MKNNTIRYMMIGFGFSLLLLIVSTIASYISINRLIDSSETVNKSNKISLELESIISNIKDAETGFRGFMLTKDSAFLNPYNGAYERTIQSFDNVKALTENNPVQQKNLGELLPLVEKRFGIFDEGFKLYAAQKSDKKILYMGRAVMIELRAKIDKMQSEEARILENQNQELKQYTSTTPILVVGAALLSVLITMIAFMRIRSDLKKREIMQLQMEEAAEYMKQRVAIITDVAEKISTGNYSIRINDKDKGSLGELSDSLNQMAADLEANFSKLEKQAWLQQGVVQVNDQLKGEKNPAELTQNVLTDIIHYLKANIGILYIVEDAGGYLVPTASYACKLEPQKRILFGEGLVGQAASDKSPNIIQNVPDSLLRINSGLLEGPPTSVIIYPFVYNDILQGVVEIGTTQEVTEQVMDFLNIVSANTAVAINTSKSRLRLHDLLQETQAQSEELQVQQDELQHSNVELELQSQKLQASEEELRVQQEELLQSNQELEENAQLLEEKNQFIEHKSKELLQLNNEVEVKNKDLELASKYKSEFLANMSHELRTPLNSILLLAKLLAESKELELGDDRYEYAKVIHSSGLGLLELINEILDLSKIEAGQMQIAIEEVGFKEIVTDMASMFNPLAKDKGLALLLDFDPALPQFIQSDKQRLEQVLKNLLSNAIKFTEQGSVNMHITNADNYIFAGGNTGKQTIAFSVKDTGIGIPADQQALVFEAFKQVDGSSRRKYGGTGLGLSISREITKLLGGELKLESEDGVGSTFTIYLPLAYEVAVQETEPVKSSQEETKEIFKQENIAEEVSKAENVEYELPEPQVQDDRDAITKSDKSILIVEDDIPFAKALSQFVKSSNYKVLVATRGDEGFAMAKKYQPAGVLLDINLPVMNGWSVLEHLKQDHATRHIPVHTMSSEEARQKSLSLGAIDFINKPLAEKELGNVLHRIEEISKKSSRSLLIIEEDKKNADALANYFREHNIHATAAHSGNEGIQLLKAKSFDGVILDISVNEKMAFNVLDQIKMIAGYETLPVIVYTGHNITSEEEDKINKYAATSIVKKANTYEKLLSEVSIFLHIMDDGNDIILKGKRANKLVERELEGKKILVADDDERNVYALTKALELQKVDVATASNGKQVLEYLENEPKIDAILIDIMMPEMDGYETIAALRQKYKYKNIPIIAVTAKTMPNDRNKCIEAGASDYISKPVDIDKLLSLLKVWLY